MANPFDQFDEVKRAAAESQSSPARPAQPTSSAGRVAANPFDQVEATGTAPTASTNDAEMNRQFLDMLNKGARPAEIFKWARDVGRPLDLTDDQKNAVAEYVTFRDKQRDRGVEGDLFKDVGMVLETDERLAPLVPGNGPQAGDIGATLREGGNTVLFNFGDELVSGVKAPFQSIFNGESIGRNYRDNWLGYNVQDEVDNIARPEASGIGTALGIAGSVALPGVATAGRGLMGRTLMGGAEGAVQGGVSATGAGDIDDRFENTVPGTIIGGGVGAALPGAIEVVGRVARPIVERLPGADSAKALARRLGLSVEEVEEARRVAAEQGKLVGDDAVALIDALPEAGRAVVGTAGRQGAAREALQDVSRARELEAPARIQNQADRISPETRTPDELRSGITRMRDEEISAAMDAPIVSNARVGVPEPRSYSDIPLESIEDVERLRNLWRKYPFHSDAIVNTPGGRGTIFASSVDNVAEGVPASGQVIVKLDTGETTSFDAGEIRSAWDRPRLREVDSWDDASGTGAIPGVSARQEIMTLRQTPLPLEGPVVDVLTTGTGLKAIRDAINNSEDVAVRNQLEELYAGLRDIRRSTDPRLPEATQQRLQGVRLEALPFTIDMSDKISRALNRAGSYGFGGTVREAARIAPRYNEIMEDYATRTKASEAVGVGSGERSVMDEAGRVRTERAQGAGFLDEAPARYEQRVEGLSEEVPLTEWAYPEGTLYRGGAPFDPNYKGVSFLTPDEVAARGYVDMHAERFGTPGQVDAVSMNARNPAPYEAVEAAAERAGIELDNGTPASWFDVGLQDENAVRAMMDDLRQQGYDHAVLPDLPWAGQATRREDVTDWIDAVVPFDNSTLSLAQRESRPTVQIDGEGAPSERDLMRAGAAATVREEPLRAARQIVGDPNQQRRLTATVGEQEATTIRRAMDAELARVRRVQQQVTGSGPRSEGTAHAEGVVNTLYNPGPISMGREALRFLNRIGMTDRDATWIVQNATDPRQTEVILNRLEQLGLDRLRAESYVDILRTMLVRGTTSPEE